MGIVCGGVRLRRACHYTGFAWCNLAAARNRRSRGLRGDYSLQNRQTMKDKPLIPWLKPAHAHSCARCGWLLVPRCRGEYEEEGPLPTCACEVELTKEEIKMLIRRPFFGHDSAPLISLHHSLQSRYPFLLLEDQNRIVRQAALEAIRAYHKREKAVPRHLYRIALPRIHRTYTSPYTPTSPFAA